MSCHLMRNKSLDIDGESEKDRFKSLETRELNDTEKFTSPVLYNILYHKMELFLSGIIHFREIWPEIVQKR